MSSYHIKSPPIVALSCFCFVDVAPAQSWPDAGSGLADLLGGTVSQPVPNSMPTIPASIGISTISDQIPSLPSMTAPSVSGISIFYFLPSIPAFPSKYKEAVSKLIRAGVYFAESLGCGFEATMALQFLYFAALCWFGFQ